MYDFVANYYQMILKSENLDLIKQKRLYSENNFPPSILYDYFAKREEDTASVSLKNKNWALSIEDRNIQRRKSRIPSIASSRKPDFKIINNNTNFNTDKRFLKFKGLLADSIYNGVDIFLRNRRK